MVFWLPSLSDRSRSRQRRASLDVAAVLLLSLLVSAIALADADDDDISESDPGWVDPDEDLFSPGSGPKPVESIPKKKTAGSKVADNKSTSSAKDCSSVSDFHLRRLVQHVVGKLDENRFSHGRFEASGVLSEYSVKVLRQYQERQAENVHVADVHDILVKLLDVKPARGSGEESAWDVVDALPFVGVASRPWYQDFLFCCLGGLALSFLLLTVLRLVTLMRTQFVETLMWCWMVLLVISVPWEWYRLYLEAQSAHVAEMMKGVPEECMPSKDVSMWSNAAKILRATFVVAEDPCLKYQKAILVDPLSDVTPAQVRN